MEPIATLRLGLRDHGVVMLSTKVDDVDGFMWVYSLQNGRVIQHVLMLRAIKNSVVSFLQTMFDSLWHYHLRPWCPYAPVHFVKERSKYPKVPLIDWRF